MFARAGILQDHCVFRSFCGILKAQKKDPATGILSAPAASVFPHRGGFLFLIFL
jgi:hypothetical protein